MFILFSLLIQVFQHLFTPVPWVKRLFKVALETLLTLQSSTILSYENTGILVHLRTTVKTCVLFVPVLMQHKEFLQ